MKHTLPRIFRDDFQAPSVRAWEEDLYGFCESILARQEPVNLLGHQESMGNDAARRFGMLLDRLAVIAEPVVRADICYAADAIHARVDIGERLSFMPGDTASCTNENRWNVVGFPPMSEFSKRCRQHRRVVV